MSISKTIFKIHSIIKSKIGEKDANIYIRNLTSNLISELQDKNLFDDKNLTKEFNKELIDHAKFIEKIGDNEGIELFKENPDRITDKLINLQVSLERLSALKDESDRLGISSKVLAESILHRFLNGELIDRSEVEKIISIKN